MALWYFILLFNFDRPENPKIKKHYVAGALLLNFLQNMLQNLFSMQYFVGFKLLLSECGQDSHKHLSWRALADR